MAQSRLLEAGVEWLPGRFAAGAQPDGDSVLIDAPDGWVVVDSDRSPQHAQALLDRIRAGGKPLRANRQHALAPRPHRRQSRAGRQRSNTCRPSAFAGWCPAMVNR